MNFATHSPPGGSSAWRFVKRVRLSPENYSLSFGTSMLRPPVLPSAGVFSDGMIPCNRCGESNDGESRFCVSCGAPLSGLPAATHSRAPAAPSSKPPVTTGGYTPASPQVREADFRNSLAFAETAPPIRKDEAWALPLDRPHATSGTAIPGPADVVPEYRKSIHPADVPSDSPTVLAGFLVSYDANPLGQSWPILQGPNQLGRAGAGADADIELPHATVSSRHAVILASARPGRLLLIDQASTNGTFVNETALQPDHQWPLRDNDVVRFGLFTVIVKVIP